MPTRFWATSIITPRPRNWLNYLPTTNSFEFYYQDTWKVTPQLVLDLGIRNSWAMAQGLAVGE